MATGIASPEFGLSLAPGASGTMKVTVQWNGVSGARSSPYPITATFKLTVGFRSELTGLTQNATANINVRAVSNTQVPQTFDIQNIGIAPAQHSVDGKVIIKFYNISDSIWTLGGSSNLSRFVTAPMTHVGKGSFYGIVNNTIAWNVSFMQQDNFHVRATNWQALDTYAALSGDGAYASSMDWNGNLYLINATTGKVLWQTNRSQDINPFYPPTSNDFKFGFFTSGATAFSPDNKVIAAGGSGGMLEVFSVKTGQVLWSRPFSAQIRALRFMPDGSRLIVGSGDWHLYMLNATNGATIWTGNNEYWPFFFIAMDPSASYIGAGGKDGIFTLWDARTGQVKWTKNFLNFIGQAASFVTGGGISTGGTNGVVSVWGAGVFYFDSTGNLIWQRSFSNPIATMSQDGQYILVGDYNVRNITGPVYLLDDTGSVIWSFTPDPSRTCQYTGSPFARVQIKGVMIYGPSDGNTITAAASCIGGTVFYFQIPVKRIQASNSTVNPASTTIIPSIPQNATSGSGNNPISSLINSIISFFKRIFGLSIVGVSSRNLGTW